ncbi:MAG: Gfo/Idh/MocA family oxidoreductase [Pirellulales bacterium]
MKTYRVAVIGRTGRGDYGHGIDTVWLEAPGVEVVAVADDDKPGLAAAARRLGVNQAFSDYREMLDKVKPDIVGIGPRWLDQHRDMVVAAAERGIHMYLEKPFCRTLAEADEMVAACERTHAKLAIAHQTRYSPKIDAVEQIIESGKIGRVLHYRGRGKEDRRGGGEDLWVLGSHVMDLIRLFGGQPQWCFARVSQEGRPISKQDVAEGNEGIGPLAGDAVNALYGMADGSTASFDSYRNTAGRLSRFGLQIYGTEGIVEILTGYLPSVKYLPDPSWSPGRSGAAWQDVSSAGIGVTEPLADGGAQAGNLLAVKDLISAIEENRQPMGNIYEARGATEMIVAIFESQRAGKPVALPLENRQNPLTMLS